MLEITHTLLDRHGITKVEPEHFRDRDDLPVTQKMRMLSFMMKIRPEFVALYGENLGKIHLFDGMLELLLACRKKGCRRAGLPPKTIKEFAKDHGVAMSDLLYIGDEIRDVKACNRCGVDIAFVRWGLDAGASLEEFEVRYEVDTPKALAELLLGIKETAQNT